MVWASLLLLLVSSLSSPQIVDRRGRAPRKQAPAAYLKYVQSRQDRGNQARVVLRSGVVVLFEEQPAYPLVVVRTVIKGGSLEEHGGERGAASLLGRLLFTAGGFAEGVQRLSGVARLETAEGFTAFLSVIPAENLAKCIHLHETLFTFPEVSQQRVALEKGFLELQRERERQPKGLQAKLASPESGGTAAFDSMDLAKLRTFHGRLYRPSRTILVITGAGVREQVLPMLGQPYLAGRASPEPARLATAAADSTGLTYRFAQSKVQQPYIFLDYRVPGPGHADYWPLVVLRHALGSGQGAPLPRYVIDRQKQALLVDTTAEMAAQGGRLRFRIVPVERQTDGAEMSLIARLRDVGRYGLTPDQLNRGKAMSLAELWTGWASLEGRSQAMASLELTGNGLDRDGLRDKIAAVTADDVKRVAARYLSERNLSVVELFPESSEVRTFTAATFLDAVNSLLPQALKQVEEARQLDIPGQEELSFEPVLSFKPDYLRTELKKTSIIRGPIVYYQEDHSLPLTHFGVFYPGGRSQETPGNRGITELMMRSVLRGALRPKGPAAALDFDRTGGLVTIVNEPDFFGFQATVLSQYSQSTLSAIVDWLRQKEVADEDIEFARRQATALLAAETDSGLSGLGTKVWGEHPYGRSRFGTREDLQSIQASAVEQWRKEHLGVLHPLILVRGDVAGSAFLEGLVSTLSDTRLKNPQIEPPESVPAGVRVIQQEGGDVAFVGPPAGTRDEHILDVVESILGGPGGRLATDMWGASGLAFPKSFRHQPMLQGSTVTVRLLSAPDKHPAAQAELLRQLALLKNEPIKRDVLLSGISRSIGRFYDERQEARAWILGLALHVFCGGRGEWSADFLDVVRSLEPADVQAFAADYLPAGQTNQPAAEPK